MLSGDDRSNSTIAFNQPSRQRAARRSGLRLARSFSSSLGTCSRILRELWHCLVTRDSIIDVGGGEQAEATHSSF